MALQSGLIKRLVVALVISTASITGAVAYGQNSKSSERKLETLIANLSSEDQEVRLNAVAEIGDIRLFPGQKAKSIPHLQKLLKDRSLKVRIKVANVLHDMDQSVVILVPTVVEGLSANDPEIRKKAIYLLWRFGRNARLAIDEVAKSMGDDDAEIRWVAAAVLGQIGPDHKKISLPLLLAALKDKNRKVRSYAAESVGLVDGPLDRAIPVLVEIMREGSQDQEDIGLYSTTYDCVATIAGLGVDGVDAIPALVEALKQGGIYRQTSIALALREMGPRASPAVEALGVALLAGEPHGIPFVHRTWCASDDAAAALAAIGSKAVPVLIAALSDSNERVRANAANALGEIPEAATETVPLLIKLLSDKSAPVRAHAAWALGKIGSPAQSATPHLVQLLFDNTEWNSAPAGGGIAQEYSVPWHAVEAISRIKPANMQLLQSFRESLEKNKSINFAVATTISTSGANGKSLVPQLEELLKTPSFRASAGYTIANIAPDVHGLSAALETSLVDDKGEVNRVAARALGILGERARRSIPQLREGIRIGDESDFVGGSSDMIVCALAILKIDPTDMEASKALVVALNTSHWAFDAYSVEEAQKTMPSLIKKQEFLRTQVIAQLKYETKNPDFPESKARDLTVQLRAAKVLSATDIATKETITALQRICREGRYRNRGEAIELLGKFGPKAIDSVDLLVEYLDDFETYSVGGNFYGYGGIRFTNSQRSVDALATIGEKAVPALIKKLDDPCHLVRSASAKSLGLIGTDASLATKKLIDRSTDSSHVVRLEAVTALGRIALQSESVDQNVLDVLERARKENRPSIRFAADKALRSIRNR